MTRPGATWRNESCWDRRWLSMSRDELDRYHLKRIRELIAYSYERVPFYRRLYDAAGVTPERIRTLHDFYEHVPSVDKADLLREQGADAACFALEATPREARAWFHQTSGTTGSPLREVFTSYDRQIAAYDAPTFGWWDAGLRPGDSVYLAFNFGTFIGFWCALFAAERVGLMVIPGGGLNTRARLRQIAELAPDAVVGTPTYLMRMGETAQDEGIDLPSVGVRYLSTAGEVGPSVLSFRDALRELWGGPTVVDLYGLSENIFGATECRLADADAVNGFHVIERYMHSYACDVTTGRPVADPDEVGEHIVTTYRIGQPLIKYRTHDLVRHRGTVDHGCGWNFAFLEGGVLGRTDDMVTIKGTNVYTSTIQRIVGTVEGLSPHYELHIDRDRGLDRLSVRVEAVTADSSPAGETYDHLRKVLVEEVRHRIGISVAVDVLAPSTLERYELKTKRVFDHRREG